MYFVINICFSTPQQLTLISQYGKNIFQTLYIGRCARRNNIKCTTTGMYSITTTFSVIKSISQHTYITCIQGTTTDLYIFAKHTLYLGQHSVYIGINSFFR